MLKNIRFGHFHFKIYWWHQLRKSESQSYVLKMMHSEHNSELSRKSLYHNCIFKYGSGILVNIWYGRWCYGVVDDLWMQFGVKSLMKTGGGVERTRRDNCRLRHSNILLVCVNEAGADGVIIAVALLCDLVTRGTRLL